MSRSSTQPRGAGDESAGAIGVAAGIVAGFALLAVVNACAIAARVPFPSGGLRLRLAHHLFDAAETLGLGAVIALAAAACVRLVRAPWWALVSVATVAIAYRVIGWRLLRFASHAMDGRFESAIFLLYFALLGVGAPVAFQIAILLSRHPRLRVLPATIAVCVLIGDQLYLPDDYPDMHGIVALGAALFAGVGLAPIAERAARILSRTRSGRAALVTIGLLAIFGAAFPPSNATRVELFRQPCPIGSWVLAASLWRPPPPHVHVPLPPAWWIEDRSQAPAIAPTRPPLLPPDPVVVLVTIDALRADPVSDPANDHLFPAFAALKREGVVFTHASAPGAETVVSLSALFSGVYFSEQRWADHGVGTMRALFPADDSSRRFPQVLSDHGVATASYAGLSVLAGDFGVARGFREERYAVQGWRRARGALLIAPLLDRLAHPGPGPLFLYVHLMDAHQPYEDGPPGGTLEERYFAGIAGADAAVGRIALALSRGFGKRWALFVTADHGEAFGEHQTYDHAKTLYEELVHVPLLARSPLFAPRAIDERVGLIDLAPTILDLFGAETPATFEGQSLVPLLEGGVVSFRRPLLAEGRLRRAITEPDGLKVIDDPRRKVVEAYDLSVDPGETRNLFDVDAPRVDPALVSLRAFFAVHTYRGEGYELPYRP